MLVRKQENTICVQTRIPTRKVFISYFAHSTLNIVWFIQKNANVHHSDFIQNVTALAYSSYR